MAKQDKKIKIKIRILPLRGIGGVGSAGDTAWMTKEEADYWVKEGYVEIMTKTSEPVPSSVADAEPAQKQLSLDEESSEEPGEEDHTIMKPENARD